ncbi:MAG: hypothetical protein U5K54_29310 [Cytophagales bacterium]|nr:hypothetical protein [Cytophagales bacterium]
MFCPINNFLIIQNCFSKDHNVILRYDVATIKDGFLQFIFIAGTLMLYSVSGFSQTTDWNLVDGKAIVEKKLTIAGKSQSDIYKNVYRWMIKFYKDPEDILKARIENEYLRGVGYVSDCVRFGAQSTADLQYMFTFEIKNEEVIFKIFDASLLYSWEDVGIHPVENFLSVKNSKKNKPDKESEMILASLNDFSNSIFQSFENHLFTK